MTTVNFKSSREDMDLAFKIARRAGEIAAEAGFEYKPMDCAMDIIATHANGCPLKLKELAETDSKFDFAHDVFGIRRHLDRDTGHLGGCFLPRFAA